MKKNNGITLLFLLLVFCGCNTGNKKTKGYPRLLFLNDTFDFKKIKKGTITDVSFAMKNTGTEDLLIKNTSVGCGCTTVRSLKDTVLPGETLDLKLVYDSKEDSGNVLKTFVVETNTTPKLHVLYIKGLVE